MRNTINSDLIKIIDSNLKFEDFCFKQNIFAVDRFLFTTFVAENPDPDRPDAFFVDVDDNANVVLSWYYGDIDLDTGEALDPDAVEEYTLPLAKVFESFKHYLETFLTQEKEGYNLPF